jgi:hypothetical protein
MMRKHEMDKDEIKHILVNMLVNSSAYLMAINESVQEQLTFN